MTTGWFVTSNDIKHWTQTNKRRAEEILPELIRRLIRANCKPEHIHFPSGDSIAVSGWDGTLEVDKGNEFVPSGFSVWEFGTNNSINNKFESDYQKRTDDPGEFNTSETTFVFTTSRTWRDKDSKCAKKNKEGIWKQVKGINADDLENWLHQCPSVHRWFANLIGKKAEAIWDIELAWESWIHCTSIPATSNLVLNGRAKQSEELSKSLKGDPAIIRIKANSENEAYAFGLATLRYDEELAPKVLIVEDQNLWDILLDTQNTLILIPQRFSPKNIGLAKQKGHFIVLPIDSNAKRTASQEIQLGKMSRDDRINALQSMGVNLGQAEKIYNDTRGYLGPILRHEILEPQEYNTPEWIDKFDANILVAALMSTEWNNRKEKDKEALSRLADVPYEQLEEKLLELATVSEAPVRLVGSNWQAVSKIDLWSLVAHKINKQRIERLESVIFDILGESDPSYDLPPEERWMANIKGAVPEYSKVLKSGLADTVAFLAVFGDSTCQNVGEITLTDRMAYWINELLKNDVSARGWYSFGSNLLPLAEASPESFLQHLESSMQGSEPPISPLFVEGGEFGGCLHSNLLWAIEIVSWDLNYLPRVTRALARLSEINPGGRYINRPFNSLKEIFLGWANNTRATYEDRLQIIDANLVRFHPDVGWRLLISLLPERIGGISTPIHKPDYRDWAEGIKKEIITREYYQYIERVVDRLLSLVNEKPISRWPELVEKIDQFPENKFDEFIEKILSIELDELGDEVRLEIADRLRICISRHREYKDAEWALPESAVDKLEKTYTFIVPDDSLLKNKYLFNEFPNLINPIIRQEIDSREREEIIRNYRQDALVEIYQTKGIDGVKQLANSCTHPHLIGNVIATSEIKRNLDNELMEWLDSDKIGLITVSRSFIFSCKNNDDEFIKSMFEQCGVWSNDKLASFLLGLPFDQDTFDILKEVKIEVNKKYWKEVRIYYLKDDEIEKINWVIEKLLGVGRPLAAIIASGQILFGSQCKVSLDCNLLGEILKKIAVDPTDDEQIPISQVRFNILKAIEYIQEQEQLPREEIVQIEWMYLKIFRFESVKPRFLEEEIINNPAFFAQLVSWVFKPEEGEEDTHEESIKLRTENAWELLNNISILPGQNENSSIDGEKLREWVYGAREKLKHLGIMKFGDDQIGKILSNSPLGTDEIWPHEAIRDLVEELQNPELEEAIEVGRFNSRGATFRSPFDGGKQERELAEKYQEQVEQIMLQWPRTSEILRRLGRSYERDANREDQQVELIE